MRIYVGGLSPGTTDADLRAQLGRYGTVEDVHLPSAEVGGHRGHAFAEMVFKTEADRKKLMSLTGSIWRGGRLRIEPVKRTVYLDSPVHEHSLVAIGKDGRKRYGRPLVRHADHFEDVVSEKNVDKKRRDWWYRGKYGRPVAVMRMRARPGNGQLMTIDPAHHKDRYEKLFGSEKPKSVQDLCWNAYTYTTNVDPADSIDQEDSGDDAGHHASIDSHKDYVGKDEHGRPGVGSENSVLAVEGSERSSKAVSIKHLLYDVDQLQSLRLFFRDAPYDKLRLEWIKQRSGLRSDFKRRLKQANRLLRKRQSSKMDIPWTGNNHNDIGNN